MISSVLSGQILYLYGSKFDTTDVVIVMNEYGREFNIQDVEEEGAQVFFGPVKSRVSGMCVFRSEVRKGKERAPL